MRRVECATRPWRLLPSRPKVDEPSNAHNEPSSPYCEPQIELHVYKFVWKKCGRVPSRDRVFVRHVLFEIFDLSPNLMSEIWRLCPYEYLSINTCWFIWFDTNHEKDIGTFEYEWIWFWNSIVFRTRSDGWWYYEHKARCYWCCLDEIYKLINWRNEMSFMSSIAYYFYACAPLRKSNPPD